MTRIFAAFGVAALLAAPCPSRAAEPYRLRQEIVVLGPAAAPIERLKRDYRYHFILKSQSRQKLNAVLRDMLAQAEKEKIPRTNVIVDVDALWLM